MNEEYATVNITYAGHNADLPDPVLVTATDTEVRNFVREAVRAGFAGMPANADVEVSDFVVERYSPNDANPAARMVVRPKVPFGAR